MQVDVPNSMRKTPNRKSVRGFGATYYELPKDGSVELGHRLCSICNNGFPSYGENHLPLSTELLLGIN